MSVCDALSNWRVTDPAISTTFTSIMWQSTVVSQEQSVWRWVLMEFWMDGFIQIYNLWSRAQSSKTTGGLILIQEQRPLVWCNAEEATYILLHHIEHHLTCLADICRTKTVSRKLHTLFRNCQCRHVNAGYPYTWMKLWTRALKNNLT